MHGDIDQGPAGIGMLMSCIAKTANLDEVQHSAVDVLQVLYKQLRRLAALPSN
jgi:hypothetical protein